MSGGVFETHRIEDLPANEAQCQPVIIRGGCSDWPALKRWDRRSVAVRFVKLHGKTSVDVVVSNSERFYGGDGHSVLPPMLFEEYVSRILSPSTPDVNVFLAQTTIFSNDPSEAAILPKLMEDIQIPHVLRADSLVSANLWFSGPKPTYSTFHFDAMHGLLCLVSGRKTVKLVSPEHSNKMHMRSLSATSRHHSDFDDTSDGEQNVSEWMQTVVMRPGDCLFIPEGWWHSVKSEPLTIAVNFWWHNSALKTLKEQKHMRSHYVRELMADILDDELKVLSPIPLPLQRAEGSNLNNIWTCLLTTKEKLSQVLDGLSPDLFELCIMTIATDEQIQTWMEGLDDASIHSLTGLLDRLPSTYDTQRFFEKLFTTESEESTRRRKMLLDGNARYARRVFDRLQLSVFGNA